MSDSLDGPLKLSTGQMQQCLNQLAQGRGIPGPPKPGQGQGQGMTGEGGTGMSPGRAVNRRMARAATRNGGRDRVSPARRRH